MVLRTLPLSGRQQVWGGVAEALWGPVHSSGLLGLIQTMIISSQGSAASYKSSRGWSGFGLSSKATALGPNC